jgi:hypothetical protein
MASGRAEAEATAARRGGIWHDERGEPVDAQDAGPAEHQRGEDRTLPAARYVQRATVQEDLERPEHADTQVHERHAITFQGARTVHVLRLYAVRQPVGSVLRA